MATVKQLGVRVTDEDLDLLGQIQARTGLVTHSDVLRFTLRQYALAEGLLDLSPKAKPKPAKPKR
jgi:hypothetical protein